MKLPRRAAAGLAAFLMAASLALAPSVGRAHYIDGPLNNPPPRDGEPDEPGYMTHTLLEAKQRLWLGRIRIVPNGLYLRIYILPKPVMKITSPATPVLQK